MPDWDTRYTSDGYLFGTEPATVLPRQAAHLPTTGRALCVADGEGRNAVWLAERGIGVTAFDASPVAVEKARRLAADRGQNVEFQVADAESFNWPDAAFDVVVGIFIQFAQPAERLRMFDAMKRSTRPGGIILLHGYTPKQLEFGTGGPPHPDHLYTERMLRDAFSDWRIVTLDAFEADLAEGTAHVGRSAVIDLIARRPA
ncbi:class I SAM-dependent methyltransferase [Palleronia sp. LCG004]|uniref:class I SAM-dependent methyltransferase n=1 Tax=Palleronia sp. LCG004 TaxID=3079304 RepID=UPI002942EAF5|nr:class I SAM-dependent methyltransferase [Palleronia sp. LCG004]WOI57950.1 class I SAM-dependent methyltransferase [Palleronia sp. LCG004]